MKNWHGIEPSLILLFMGLVFFTGILIFVEWKFSSDGQVFQVIAGLVTGFASSLFTKLKVSKDSPDTTTTATVSGDPPAATVTTQKTE